MAESDEMSGRNHVRRGMAFASMLLCIAITMCELACLFSDQMAGRNDRVWPALSVLFAALMGYVGFYTHVGSRENRDLIAKENK